MTLNVAHVITGLQTGGAERVLHALAAEGRRRDIEPAVICLGSAGPVSEMLRADGVHVEHVNMRSVWHFPLALGRVRRALDAIGPDIVQGWMYHGNVAATLANRDPARPVAWNVRQSLHRTDLFKMTTRLTIRANAMLSARPAAIVYNSQVARTQHESIGFASQAGTLIPNGVDLRRFGGVRRQRAAMRETLGIAADELLAIAVGRVHPIKGHELMLRAMARAGMADDRLRLLVVGRGADWESEPFARFADSPAVRSRTTLLGERENVPELLGAADVFLSASLTEGFPNALAEAMAAGLPGVVTDVGDSRMLLGESGTVVTPNDEASLADALVELLGVPAEHRRAMGDTARATIERDYSLDKVADRYAGLYERLVAAAGETVAA